MDFMREILASAVFAVLAALFLRMIIVSIHSAVLRRHSPNENVLAHVAAKRTETGEGEFVKNGVRPGKTVYYLSFVTENGEELSFDVLKSEYDAVCEGDTGYLIHSANKFFRFEKDMLLKESDINEKTAG